MRLAYIVGPYSSRWGIFGRVRNIYKARKVAINWWRKGYAVISPHSNTALFDKYAPYETWIAGDLEILSRCDLLILMDGWENSKGARRELAEARRLHIEVMEDYT